MPVTPTPPELPATSITPQTFNQCMTECFALMGAQTREFVINTIKIHIDQLISGGTFDVNHYKQVIDEIIKALDGDEKQEGFQRFVQLITDVNILKQEHITQVDVVNIIKRVFVSENVQVNNNFITSIAQNEVFINEIKNNSTVVNVMVNNAITTIINYLSRSSNNDAMGDQFVAILSQFINNQFVQINNSVTNQITQVKTDLTNQINVSIESVQTNITRISTELTRINTYINNCSTKDDLAGIRKELEVFNSLRIQFLKLQSDVNDLSKKCGDANFYSNIDLSRNVSIVNVVSQLTTINQSITELNVKISQYADFVNKNDLANACAAACAIFVKTLTGAK